MKLIVGLGNPGAQYETTRHNVGWLALDRLIDEWKAAGPSTQNQAETWTCSRGGEKVILMKPLTYMNKSGIAVAPVMKFYKLAPADLIVLYDDLDLPPHSLKLKTGGGTGGHNGLKSIEASTGETGYHRFRIGIGHPRDFNPRMDPADWVLGHYPDADLAELDRLFDRVARAMDLVVAGDMRSAMNRFNTVEKKPAAEAKPEKK